MGLLSLAVGPASFSVFWMFIAQTRQPSCLPPTSSRRWNSVMMLWLSMPPTLCLCLKISFWPVCLAWSCALTATLEMSEIKGKDEEPLEGDGDYESLPPHASLTIHMTAGAVAGILEHTVMYPVDSVKVGGLATPWTKWWLNSPFHSHHYAFLLSSSPTSIGGNNLTRFACVKTSYLAS